jgi:hypothetical protein
MSSRAPEPDYFIQDFSKWFRGDMTHITLSSSEQQACDLLAIKDVLKISPDPKSQIPIPKGYLEAKCTREKPFVFETYNIVLELIWEAAMDLYGSEEGTEFEKPTITKFVKDQTGHLVQSMMRCLKRRLTSTQDTSIEALKRAFLKAENVPHANIAEFREGFGSSEGTIRYLHSKDKEDTIHDNTVAIDMEFDPFDFNPFYAVKASTVPRTRPPPTSTPKKKKKPTSKSRK